MFYHKDEMLYNQFGRASDKHQMENIQSRSERTREVFTRQKNEVRSVQKFSFMGVYHKRYTLIN